MHSDCPSCCCACKIRASRKPPAGKRRFLPSRCANHPRGAASWLPCQPDACASRIARLAALATPGYVPGNTCCAIAFTAAPTVMSAVQGIAVVRSLPVRKCSPAPKHTHVRRRVSGFLSAPSVVCCKGAYRRKQGRVNCPVSGAHMSSSRRIAANRRQSYGYRSVQWSSLWIAVHLI
jgi:hypothetical protein